MMAHPLFCCDRGEKSDNFGGSGNSTKKVAKEMGIDYNT